MFHEYVVTAHGLMGCLEINSIFNKYSLLKLVQYHLLIADAKGFHNTAENIWGLEFA